MISAVVSVFTARIAAAFDATCANGGWSTWGIRPVMATDKQQNLIRMTKQLARAKAREDRWWRTSVFRGQAIEKLNRLIRQHKAHMERSVYERGVEILDDYERDSRA